MKPMRADAKQNFGRLLAVARDVIAEQGAEASLRDIARRAEVGLGTLYRHFPTRDALLEELLRDTLDELTRKAGELQTSTPPDQALLTWFRDAVAFTHSYSGVVALMAAALEDPSSALYASCSAVRSAGSQLLIRAQAAGMARTDIDGTDLFALIGSLAWIHDQTAFASRADHLRELIASAILTKPSRASAKKR